MFWMGVLCGVLGTFVLFAVGVAIALLVSCEPDPYYEKTELDESFRRHQDSF
jgi:hypothetical protein